MNDSSSDLAAASHPAAPITGWTRIPNRCRFLLLGADRERYLNGQVTNQIRGLESGQSRYACITNHKGQLEGDVFVAATRTPTGDADPAAGWLTLDADGSLRETLFMRLDRYIIADDVTLSDITDAWSLWHLLGRSAQQVATQFPHAQLIPTNRFGLAGIDLWIPRADAESGVEDALAEAGLHEIPALVLEWMRIGHGVPKWEQELTPGLLPPEARLEGRAIDYEKGCYIGQEVISRIKSVGKVNRLLVLLELAEDDDGKSSPPEPGQSLWLASAEGGAARALGTITSVATGVSQSPREVLALGYLKSQHAAPGTRLIAGVSPAECSTCLTVLPFPSHENK